MQHKEVAGDTVIAFFGFFFFLSGYLIAQIL